MGASVGDMLRIICCGERSRSAFIQQDLALHAVYGPKTQRLLQHHQLTGYGVLPHVLSLLVVFPRGRMLFVVVYEDRSGFFEFIDDCDYLTFIVPNPVSARGNLYTAD